MPAIDALTMAEGGIVPFWTVADRENEAEWLTFSLHQKARQLENQGSRVRVHTAHGQPAEQIMRIAKDEHADLIVLPAHGRGGARSVGLGSVANRIAQGASTPVLLLRTWEHPTSLARHGNRVEDLTAELVL
jgi:nucleotide-binding universal stress UspA family protein